MQIDSIKQEEVEDEKLLLTLPKGTLSSGNRRGSDTLRQFNQCVSESHEPNFSKTCIRLCSFEVMPY